MKTSNYQVPSPTSAQISQYEKTGCSATSKRVHVAKTESGIIHPVKMTKDEIQMEARRLARKYCLGIE